MKKKKTISAALLLAFSLWELSASVVNTAYGRGVVMSPLALLGIENRWPAKQHFDGGIGFGDGTTQTTAGGGSGGTPGNPPGTVQMNLGGAFTGVNELVVDVNASGVTTFWGKNSAGVSVFAMSWQGYDMVNFLNGVTADVRDLRGVTSYYADGTTLKQIESSVGVSTYYPTGTLHETRDSSGFKKYDFAGNCVEQDVSTGVSAQLKGGALYGVQLYTPLSYIIPLNGIAGASTFVPNTLEGFAVTGATVATAKGNGPIGVSVFMNDVDSNSRLLYSLTIPTGVTTYSTATGTTSVPKGTSLYIVEGTQSAGVSVLSVHISGMRN